MESVDTRNRYRYQTI